MDVGIQMLDELSDMLVERLLLYEKKNRKLLPKRIFVFRDGVSEVSKVQF
jgi:eukaryotic translation initiation factor 2C